MAMTYYFILSNSENRTHSGTKTDKNVFDNPNFLQNLWKKNGLLKQVRFCYAFSKT